MPEYIERENLFKFLTGQMTRKQNGAFAKGFNKGIMVARAAVHNKEITPAADVVEIVHGEWKKGHYEGGLLDGVNFDKCNICGHERMIENVEYKTAYNYCPNCGAKMDATDIDVGTKTNLPDDVRQNILNTFMKGSKD